MKTIFLLILALFSLISAFSQNLIPNASFENTKNLPCNWIQNRQEFENAIHHWQMPTLGTPDIWSLRTDPDCRLSLTVNQDVNFDFDAEKSKPFFELLFPFSGESMLALMTVSKVASDNHTLDYREYALVELTKELQQGKMYHFEMNVAWAKGVRYSSNGLGAAFSSTLVKENHASVLKELKPFFCFENIVNADTGVWTKVSIPYEAKGGEKFLILGNFFDGKRTKIKEEKSHTNYAEDPNKFMAYYFIDELWLSSKEDFEKRDFDTIFPPYEELEYAQTDKPESEKDVPIGKKIIMENIHFATGQSALLPDSKKSLDFLLKVMNENPYMQILVIGHTDNVGKAEANLQLSKNRALAVKDFLINNGIAPERIKTRGYGATQPIADNDKPEGRQKNRRVEVVFDL
jgi:outer membrane protein OmpA-like peptidoglycan-associated protein